MTREIYFGHLYRIWKVGEGEKERRAFWENNFVEELTSGDETSDFEALQSYEEIHLDGLGVLNSDGEEILDAKWPSPQEIYIEKYYFDHGVADTSTGRIRYFKSHFPDHFECNKTEHLSDERVLSDCELAFIISYHEYEADPDTSFS